MKRLALSLVALLLVSCTSAYGRAARRDDAEGWSAFLGSGKGSEEEQERAQARLDALAWADARRADTIAGYNRYVEHQPEGAHLTDARNALEGLRYRQALESPGPWALEDFLNRHPSGRHARAARAELVERSRQAALEAGDPGGYAAWLARWPEAPGAAELRSALAEAAFTGAADQGTVAALGAYLQRFPDAARRPELERQARALEVRAGILSGRGSAAEALVASTGDPEARAYLEAAARDARLEQALTALDRAALETLAQEGVAAAGRAHEALVRRPDGAALEAAARSLATPAPGLAPTALAGALVDGDPRRRRMAIRALGFAQSPDALEALQTALADRNLLVRFEALVALRRLGPSLHPVVRDVAFSAALQRLEGLRVDADLDAVASALAEAAGHGGVLEGWRRAARHPERPEAGLRLAELETDPQRRRVALNAVTLPLRDEALARLPAVVEARSQARLDRALLRQAVALEHALGRALALVGPEGPQAPAWRGPVEELRAHLAAALADAEARARVLDPGWLSFDYDEGEAARARAEAERLEAVSVLAGARDLAGVRDALANAARSPFPPVAAAARRALEAP